jgi:hypothetical protein
MIRPFVDRFMASEQAIREKLAVKHPDEYKDIVRLVVEHVADSEDYERPDPERVHQIDDGDYQGTLVFVIGGTGYQPSDYWFVKVGYGSCSGCDTLESIKVYSDEPPTSGQVDDYWTLALHVAQGLKEMGGDDV